MTINEAAQILKHMYATAPNEDRDARIHLFGIRYDRELDGLNIEQILERAQMPLGYEIEIRKGRKLAKYVDVKSAYR